MKKLLLLTIFLPILAYVLLPMGDYLPEGLIVIVYALLLASAMAVTGFVTIRHPKSPGQWVLTVVGVALYAVVIVGLLDVLSTVFLRDPVILDNGSAWADIGAIVGWTVIFIPLSYIVGSAFLVVDYYFARRGRQHTKK